MNEPEVMGSTSFDSIAPSYDREFEQLPGVTRLRQIVHRLALRYFRPGDHILELNCGTGTDAIVLAQHGIHVLATDASRAMIEQADKKIRELNLGAFITTKTLSFEELHTLRNARFDGVFSNMGGLNCSATLRAVAKDLAGLVRPDGCLIACFLSDFSLWETVAFLVRGKPSKACRRSSGNPVTVSLRGKPADVYFRSPASIEADLSPHFRRVWTEGLNIFTPPPSSTKAYRRLGRGRALLEKIDDAVGRFPPFSRMGDHFAMVFRRTMDLQQQNAEEKTP